MESTVAAVDAQNYINGSVRTSGRSRSDRFVAVRKDGQGTSSSYNEISYGVE